MNPVLFSVVLFVLTFLCSLGILIGHLEDDLDLIFPSSLGLVAVCLIGWWGVGGCVEWYSKTETITPQPNLICRNDRTLFIQLEDKKIDSSLYEVYTASNDCLQVIKYIPLNLYGNPLPSLTTYTISVKH
jgi:hypothetical protein